VIEEFRIPDHLSFHDLLQYKFTKGTPMFPLVQSNNNNNNDINNNDIHNNNNNNIDNIENNNKRISLIIIERSFYDKNRHIYPQSRWEVFDDLKSYEDPRFTSRDKPTGSEEVMTAFYNKKRTYK